MTLNLMVCGRAGVFLSGDFRLTFLGAGHWSDDLNVQKLIPVAGYGWAALISYTGVARTPDGQEVGDWISQRMSALPDAAQYDDVIHSLSGAEEWLARASGYRQLTIAAVGFNRRKPFRAVLSTDQHPSKPAPTGSAHRLKLGRSRPKAVIAQAFGDHAAVRKEDLTALRVALESTRDPREIHRMIAAVNVAAEARSSTISPACVTGHLLPTGAGEIMVHGIDAAKEYVPNFIKRELSKAGVRGFKLKVDSEGKPLAPRWKGMTLKVETRKGKPPAIVGISVFANVDEPISGPARDHHTAFWKIAGPDEPERHTFKFGDAK